jgi:hypothetical protein
LPRKRSLETGECTLQMRAVLFVALTAPCAAFVATPRHSSSLYQTPSSCIVPRTSTPFAGPKKPKKAEVQFSGFSSAEEERRQKLEVGCNFPPRTSTVPGEGYQFFQGPTPKTGIQENLPSFFEFKDIEVTGKAKIFIGLAIAGPLALAAVVSIL